MKQIKFITGCSPYQSGEIAGFSDEQAEKYVKAGYAQYYPVEVEESETEEEAEKETWPEVNAREAVKIIAESDDIEELKERFGNDERKTVQEALARKLEEVE